MINKEVFKNYEIDYVKIRKTIEEAIITTYGEEYRSIISERLKQITFITHIKEANIRRIVSDVKKDIKQQLEYEFYTQYAPLLNIKTISFEEFHAYKNNKQKTAFFNKFSTLGTLTFDKYEKLLLFNNQSPLTKDKTINEITAMCKILNKHGIDITPTNFQEMKSNPLVIEILKLLNQAHESYLVILKKYKTTMEMYQKEEKYLEEADELKIKLRSIGNLKYLEEITQYVPEAFKEEHERQIATIKGNQQLGKYYTFGSTFDSLLNFLDQESDQELLSQETSKYKKEVIIKERIKYCSVLGYQLGEDYSSYEEIFNSNRPSQEVINKCKKIKNTINDSVDNDIFLATSNYLEGMETIKNHNFLTEMDDYDEIIKENITCMVPKISKSTNLLESVIFFDTHLSFSKDFSDVRIVHEILHALESSYTKEDDVIKMHCGFEEFRTIFKNGIAIELEEERPYEKFSETIHQIITQEIVENFHNNGINIFEGPQEVLGAAAYDANIYLIKKFFKDYRNLIIEARITGNNQKLINEVGLENMNQIAQIVEERSKLSMFQIIDAKKTGIENNSSLKKKQLDEEMSNIYDKLEMSKQRSNL